MRILGNILAVAGLFLLAFVLVAAVIIIRLIPCALVALVIFLIAKAVFGL